MSEVNKRILSSLILLPTSLFFIIKGMFYFKFFMKIFFLLAAFEWNALSKGKNYKIPGFVFLIASIYFIILLR